MATRFSVSIAVEGDVDQAALAKLLRTVEIDVDRAFVQEGKDRLRENVPRYNKAAEFHPWVVLVDLNTEAECAPALRDSWLPQPSAGMQFRIAVRAVEAWLMADRSAMGRFLRVANNRIPEYPERDEKPNGTLVQIARSSPSRGVREDMVPREGSSARQGPGYTGRLIEFIEKHWNPRRASSCAASLKRAMESLGQWDGGLTG